MLGTAAHGLHGSPHVAFAWDQVPARRQELRSLNPASFVERLGSAAGAVRQHLRPHHISVSLDYPMGTTQFLRLEGIEGGVNASENHVCATITSQLSNLVSAQCIGSVDAYSDNIS